MGTKKQHGTGRGYTTARARLNKDESAALDAARDGLSIADFVVLFSCAEFVGRVKAAGWASVAEFIEAVSSGQIKLPTRPEEMPGSEVL